MSRTMIVAKRRGTSTVVYTAPHARSGPRQWWLRRLARPLVVGLVGVWAWGCAEAYLIGYYEQFGLDPEFLGYDRVSVMSRVIAVILIYLSVLGALAFVVASWAFVCRAVHDIAGGTKRGRRAAEWTAERIMRTRRLLRREATPQKIRFFQAVLACILALLVLAAYQKGERDSAQMIRRTARTNSYSFLGYIFGVRAEVVELQWVSTTRSPLRGRDRQPELQAVGRMLGQHDGTTAFYDLETCTVYLFPTSSVTASAHYTSAARPSSEPAC